MSIIRYLPVFASICFCILHETSTPPEILESLKSHRVNNARPLKGNKGERKRENERERQTKKRKTKNEEKEIAETLETDTNKKKRKREKTKKKREKERNEGRRKKLDHCPSFLRQSSYFRTMRKCCTCEPYRRLRRGTA